jgi:hypothetical protein
MPSYRAPRRCGTVLTVPRSCHQVLVTISSYFMVNHQGLGLGPRPHSFIHHEPIPTQSPEFYCCSHCHMTMGSTLRLVPRPQWAFYSFQNFPSTESRESYVLFPLSNDNGISILSLYLALLRTFRFLCSVTARKSFSQTAVSSSILECLQTGDFPGLRI